MRLHRINNVESIENPKAHLYKTASNLAIDYQRREILKKNYLRKQLGSYSEECSAETPPRLLKMNRQLAILNSRMEELPINCQKTFYLHRMCGLNYNEISKELSVSVSSVEKYLMRALKHCKDVLDEI